MRLRTVTPAEVEHVTQQDPRGFTVLDVVIHKGKLGIVRKIDTVKRRMGVEMLPATADQFDKAVKKFRRFTGTNPTAVDRVPTPELPPVAFKVGECLGVMYEAVRDGERDKYLHRFKKKARPHLACSPDGRQLYLLGGAYRFTDRGIVDNP